MTAESDAELHCPETFRRIGGAFEPHEPGSIRRQSDHFFFLPPFIVRYPARRRFEHHLCSYQNHVASDVNRITCCSDLMRTPAEELLAVFEEKLDPTDVGCYARMESVFA